MQKDLSDLVRDLPPVPTKSKSFAEVSAAIQQKWQDARQLRELIVKTEQLLATQQDALRRIEEDELTSLLDEIGTKDFILPGGSKINIDNMLTASIIAQNKDDAYAWLREKKIDIVKNVLEIKFNKGEDNLVGDLTSKAEELGLAYEKKESVHASTLKATVKEQMKKNVTFPSNLFDIRTFRKVDTK